MRVINCFEGILKKGDYQFSILKREEILDLRKRIIKKVIEGNDRFFLNCIIKKKEIEVSPKEVLRQIYTERIINEYNYPKNRIEFDYAFNLRGIADKADIVIFDEKGPGNVYIIVKFSERELYEDIGRIQLYCNAIGAKFGVWTNGGHIAYFYRKD
jgi:type I restriction enzyme M protein